MRRADPRSVAASVAVAVVVLAGCRPSGEPVPECVGEGEGRWVAIVRPGLPTEGERPLAIECWREVGPERIELWFSVPAGSECWELSAVDLRESGDAIAVSLAAVPAAVCQGDVGTEGLTQIELQAPVDDRAVLDGTAG